MQQNSEEWLEFRKTKIGASDANIIMGVSEYMSPLDLYLEKKGLPPRRKVSDMEFIGSKGHWLEDKIRAEIELETGCDFPPEIRVHSQIDYIMASMDGHNEKWGMSIECKYVGQKKYKEFLDWEQEQEFPFPQFYPQVQQQYLCAGSKKVAVVAITEQVELSEDGTPYKPDGKLIYILDSNGKKTYKKTLKHVPINLEYIKNELIPAVVNFQKNYIELNIEPPATDQDIIEIKNLEVGKKVTEYKKNQIKIASLKDKLKPLETIEKKLKKEIFKMDLVNCPKMTCKGISLSQTEIDGKIDYESAFNSLRENLEAIVFSLDNYETLEDIRINLNAALNLNLDNFKKANSKRFSITLPKTKTKVEDIKVVEKTKTTKLGDISVTETIKATTTKKDKVTVKSKMEEWSKMSTEQQKATAKSNAFKTEKGKSPNKWETKTREQKIKYLESLAKKSTSSEAVVKSSLELAKQLKELF